MKRMNMKQNLLNPLDPLTILGFFRGVVLRFMFRVLRHGVKRQCGSGFEPRQQAQFRFHDLVLYDLLWYD